MKILHHQERIQSLSPSFNQLFLYWAHFILEVFSNHTIHFPMKWMATEDNLKFVQFFYSAKKFCCDNTIWFLEWFREEIRRAGVCSGRIDEFWNWATANWFKEIVCIKTATRKARRWKITNSIKWIWITTIISSTTKVPTYISLQFSLYCWLVRKLSICSTISCPSTFDLLQSTARAKFATNRSANVSSWQKIHSGACDWGKTTKYKWKCCVLCT